MIREYASILKDAIDGPINGQQLQRINTIISRTDDLARMVDDLLDTSRLKSGLVKVYRRAFPLLETIEKVRKLLNRRAEAKQITLSVADPANPIQVFGDERKLTRILINLVTNAIKFTPVNGRIEISVDPVSDPDRVEISVEDNGMGIPSKDLSRIFERFKQVNGHQRTIDSKGFGLGLSIANELANLNLGEMRVNSQQGQGSRFSILIPKTAHESILNCFATHADRLRTTTNQFDSEIIVFDLQAHWESETDAMDSEYPLVVEEFLASQVASTDLVLPVSESRWLIHASVPDQSIESFENKLVQEWLILKANHLGGQLPVLQFMQREKV